jgi:serine/threonine protein phosphatase PrpC
MKRRTTFAYGAATSQGNWPVQEDGFFVDPGRGLFVLADGFGGRGNGDIAAKLALQEWRGAKADLAPRESGIYSPAQAWQRELFAEVNKKIMAWNEKRSPSSRGGCSLIAAGVHGDRELTITSVGACRAFLFRGGQWLTLVSPQASPRLFEGEALFPQQALGLGRELNPETRAFNWEPGDLLFLFSSGMACERDAFQAELSGQLALRAPGSDLGDIASLVAGGGEGGSAWNQTVVAVEALA